MSIKMGESLKSDYLSSSLRFDEEGVCFCAILFRHLPGSITCNIRSYFEAFSVPVVLFSQVMEVPTDEPFTEEQGRFYFRDIVLGIEYCKSADWLITLKTSCNRSF